MSAGQTPGDDGGAFDGTTGALDETLPPRRPGPGEVEQAVTMAPEAAATQGVDPGATAQLGGGDAQDQATKGLWVCPLCDSEGLEAYCPHDGARRVDPRVLDRSDPMVGRTLAERYVIERKLGEGGMGAVYLATQRLVDRRVVVKVLHPQATGKGKAEARFLREARAASRVEHPNVVTIHDFGYADDGIAYLVMEHVDGESLDDLMDREGKLSWARAARIGAQVARALAAAHALDIVHRDIKPGNVMRLAGDSASDRVKVLDFGLARLHETEDDKITATGAVMGTPAYMAPEQVSGRDIGPPADTYALGVMLFHMVVGSTPFRGKTATDVMVKHLMHEAPPLAEAAPDEARPEAFDALVAACMAKKADSRPRAIAEVAEQLEALAAGVPLAPLNAPNGGPDLAIDARLTVGNVTSATVPGGPGPTAIADAERLKARRQATKDREAGKGGSKTTAPLLALVGLLVIAGIVAALALPGSDPAGDGAGVEASEEAGTPTAEPTEAGAAVEAAKASAALEAAAETAERPKPDPAAAANARLEALPPARGFVVDGLPVE